MSHPQKMSISGLCPMCKGKLIRETTDTAKPLGTVSCTACPYKTSISAYMKNAQASRKALAMKKVKALKKGVQ